MSSKQFYKVFRFFARKQSFDCIFIKMVMNRNEIRVTFFFCLTFFFSWDILPFWKRPHFILENMPHILVNAQNFYKYFPCFLWAFFFIHEFLKYLRKTTNTTNNRNFLAIYFAFFFFTKEKPGHSFNAAYKRNRFTVHIFFFSLKYLHQCVALVPALNSLFIFTTFYSL